MIEAPEQTDTVLCLDPEEVKVVRAALRMLKATLGREEAEELAEVKALLDKLDKPTA
jgi:hypothetical protein